MPMTSDLLAAPNELLLEDDRCCLLDLEFIIAFDPATGSAGLATLPWEYYVEPPRMRLNLRAWAEAARSFARDHPVHELIDREVMG